MLMSGVNKKTREGVNIRGDINVALIGDPVIIIILILILLNLFLNFIIIAYFLIT